MLKQFLFGPLASHAECSLTATPLDAALPKPPLTVANKRLAVKLNPLDATLTKNTGVGAPPNATIYESTVTTHESPGLPWPSTSVLFKIESFLYPEFYCSLDPPRIHSLFD